MSYFKLAFFPHNIGILVVEALLSRKGVLHALLPEQIEEDGVHVFEGQDFI